MRRNCPYRWCSAVVDIHLTAPPGTGGPGPSEYSTSKLIVSHTIESKLLVGPCPASLMYWPLTDYTKSYFDTREAIDEAKIHNALRHQEALDEAPFKPSHNTSQSMRQPGRMGREPLGRHKDWALGGREDEDVLPVDAPSEGTPMPRGVDGTTLGGTGMTTIPELTAAVQAAMAKTQEAYAMAEQTKVTLDEAKSAWMAIVADSGSHGAARNAHHALVGAVSEQDASMQAMSDSVIQGEMFINNLHA